MDTLHLAFASDANPDYLLGLTVAAGSAIRHLSRDVRPVVHILDLEIPDAAFAEIATCLSALRPDLDLRRHRIAPNDFAGMPTWRGSLAAYARLCLPSLVEADRCVYADCDVLFTDDPRPLLDENRGGYWLMGHVNVHSAWARANEYAWHERHGFPVDLAHYVCTGFLLMDLAAFRREGLEARLLDLIRANPDIVSADQSALNAICHGHIGLLPDTWGCLTTRNPSPLQVPIGAVHFGNDAPWSVLANADRPGSAAHRAWIRAARAIVPPDAVLAARIPGETAFLLRKWLPLRLWHALPRWVAAPPWLSPKRRAKRLWRRRAEPYPEAFL